MKKINKQLLASRASDLSSMVQEANFLEELAMNGKTPEIVISNAKKGLSIGEDESVIVNWKEKFREINILQKGLIDINGLTSRLKDANILEDGDLEVLSAIESRIGAKVMAAYDLEEEDLYMEEEKTDE